MLPFTFSDGALQPKAFATAFLVAIAWLISLLRFWRSRNLFWVAAGWMALFFGSKWSGVNRADVSMSAFSQWLCVVIIFAGAPLLLFRLRLLRWAGLLV
ncbi:hypothetical protein [Prosthecobacter sp.]|uniref:hypothetical protein n=1 Tax=Prosthecobacter sp. TaxID=1965333 RepID=UPI0037847705